MLRAAAVFLSIAHTLFILLWNNINSHLSNDARLRCDLVDLYYALYGLKRPICVPLPEIQAMMKQMHHKERERLERERDKEKEREKERERLKEVPEVPVPMQPVIKQEIIEDIKYEPVASEGGLQAPAPVEKVEPDLPVPLARIKSEDDVKVDVTSLTSLADVSAPLHMPMPMRVFADDSKREFSSDNAVALPGIAGSLGPVGFEPGMFRRDRDDMGAPKAKKKKKDKKKHKHKHKHKHSKDKSMKDKEHRDKERLSRPPSSTDHLKIKEETRETFSSFSSSQSPSEDISSMPSNMSF